MDTSEKKSSNGSAEPTHKPESNSEQLVEQIKLSGTPFTIVRIEDKWFLTIGKYRLTNQLNTREEAEAEVHDATWDRMMQIMKIMILEHEDEKKLGETLERQTDAFKKMQKLSEERTEDRKKFEK